MSQKQIGWYTVKEPVVVHEADFSCAAWWEDIELKPGRYPVYVYDMEMFDGEVFAQGAYTRIDGTTVADYFASHYFGMPISDYDTKKNAGKASSYSQFNYLYNIAEEILTGRSCYELLPEYEARVKHFTYEGEEHTTHGIFKIA